MSSRTHSAVLSHEEESPATRNAAIEVNELGHRYGDRVALDGISFDVRPAEIFGLLGPNGSGKTTLFRILSTLMVPSAGSALIAGFDPAKQPNQVRRRIGVVAQAQSVDVKLTARENLMHQGHLYGLSGARLKQRIAEMLERVALADRADDLVETFSGGMQRRVELAKGLMHSPAILLLDEPTTGLDPGARRDLWLYLDSLRAQEGVTVLVTTHLMEEAERCDRLAILSHGKVVALGTPAELKSEIGGDVIQFEADDPEALAERIHRRFGIICSVEENTVRLERAQGHRFAAEVMEVFASEIQSVNISRPTLEDVFVNRTGHRFWTENERIDNK
ncbi:MAG TPA: ATP-binding cassette domain-containing protein [Terriglobales bacterium]|nr:ATP-binding cassette domain-containing protein [Terriglobales bacterium]